MRTSRSRRARSFAALTALALAGCALAFGVGSSEAKTAAGATMTITYLTPTSLQVRLDDGTVLKSGSVVPAGTYSVLVFDNGEDSNPKVAITGPGVSVSTDLNSTGMGIDEPWMGGPYTFQTSSSYSIQDSNIGSSTLVSFTTSATASAGGGTTTTPTGTVSGGGTTTTTTTTSGGTAQAKMVGTLVGSVSAAGKATLKFKGKPVKSLKAGRYKITVADHSKKVGLIVYASQRAITLSSASATGTSSHTVTMFVGKSYFETSAHGRKTTFTVVG
jgi:hypothetical protein